MALAPSGGSGESHPCWAATTRSAGSSANAPPPVPSPSSRQSVGADKVTRSARHRAISPARPASSASTDNARPRCRSRSSAAGRARQPAACRDAPPAAPPGPSGWASVCPLRSCPRKTHGDPPKLARAISNPGSDSPWPVPSSGITSVAANFRKRRRPGRSGLRERVTDSQVSTSGMSSCGGSTGSGETSRRGEQHRQRPVEDRRDWSGGSTASHESMGEEVLGGLDSLGERLARRTPGRRADRGNQPARRAGPASGGPGRPRTPTPRPCWGDAGRPGTADRPSCARRSQRRSSPSARRRACPPACECRPRQARRAGGAGRRWRVRSRAPAGPRRRPRSIRRGTRTRRPDGDAAAPHQPFAGDDRLVEPGPLRAAASSAAYASDTGRRSGGTSHEENEPSSSTRSMRSVADSRSATRRL